MRDLGWTAKARNHNSSFSCVTARVMLAPSLSIDTESDGPTSPTDLSARCRQLAQQVSSPRSPHSFRSPNLTTCSLPLYPSRGGGSNEGPPPSPSALLARDIPSEMSLHSRGTSLLHRDIETGLGLTLHHPEENSSVHQVGRESGLYLSSNDSSAGIGSTPHLDEISENEELEIGKGEKEDQVGEMVRQKVNRAWQEGGRTVPVQLYLVDDELLVLQSHTFS